jgi:hypothetical protein
MKRNPRVAGPPKYELLAMNIVAIVLADFIIRLLARATDIDAPAQAG